MRLAILADPLAEGWPSMDRCAAALDGNLPSGVQGEIIRPLVARRFQRLPLLGGHAKAILADRLLCRFRAAPRMARRSRGRFDAYHIVDHTYAHLALELPAERTGVYCHDLDAFRSVLEPERDRKPAWFRRLVRRQMCGLQRARWVFHNSLATREELLERKLVDAARLVHAPLGAGEEFTAQTPADYQPPDWLAELAGSPYLLHVGSCIPRKRVDVLLRVFAGVRARHPSLRLLKVAGEWTAEHRELLRELEIAAAMTHVHDVSPADLAAAYRGARVVLQPSESEGFGLPVIEALACGATVVASDLPVLREVGSSVVVYAPVGAVDQWVEVAAAAIDERNGQDAGHAERVAHAGTFSWSRHAEIIARTYREVLP